MGCDMPVIAMIFQLKSIFAGVALREDDLVCLLYTLTDNGPKNVRLRPDHTV